MHASIDQKKRAECGVSLFAIQALMHAWLGSQWLLVCSEMSFVAAKGDLVVRATSRD